MRIRKIKPIGKKTIKYIEKLYEAYSRKLFCIAKNHVKDNDLAQDVVQSVFEKALVYPESILKVPEEEVFYFLTAITKNESFTLLKNEKNNEHESLTYEDGSEGDFVEDQRTGRGIYTWPDGRRYVGEFVDGYLEGYGTFVSGNGEKKRGLWLKNQIQG